MANTKLTPKQALFCKEYVACKFNGTKAAIAAGYSEDTAKEIGSENLTKPNIKEEIERLTKSTNEKLDITAFKVMQEFAKLGFALTNKVDGFDMDLTHKLKALEALAKHTGAFNADETQKGVINVNIGKKP